MMNELSEKRYRISEVSGLTEVPPHLLRQWEQRFPQLKPKRDRANRRYFLAADIEIVRRIKHLLRHEGMTVDGARKQLARELHGEGRPKSRREVVELLDRIDGEIRAMLELLDHV